MGLSEDLERVALQERELGVAAAGCADCLGAGTRLRAMAVERKLVLVIDVRRFGQPLFYAGAGGHHAGQCGVGARKSNVVARFHRSSYGVGMTLKKKNTTLLERQGLPVAVMPRMAVHFRWLLRARAWWGSATGLRIAAAQRPRAGGGGVVLLAGTRLCGVAAGQRAGELALSGELAGRRCCSGGSLDHGR